MLSRLAIPLFAGLLAATSAEAQSARPSSTTTLISGGAPEYVRPLIGAGVYRATSELGYYLNGGVSLSDTTGTYGSTSTATSDSFGTGYFLNIGASMPVGGRVTLYGGIGLAGVSGANDPSLTTRAITVGESSTGAQGGEDALGPNYNAGILVSAGSMVLEAGYNTYFETGYVGIGFGF